MKVIQSLKTHSNLAFMILLPFIGLFAIHHAYNVSNFFQFIDEDRHQLLANAFRNFSLKLDPSTTCLLDLTDRGGTLYFYSFPVPAIIYAIIDSLSLLFTNHLFPKVFLFVLFSLANIIAFYLFTKDFLKKSALLAFLGTLIYIYSFPFYYFLTGENGPSQVFVLYGSTFFLFGLIFYFRAIRNKTNIPIIWAGIFFSLALGCRIPYWFYICVMSLALLVFSKLSFRAKTIYLGIILIAVSMLAWYNYARFGIYWEFGENFIKYKGTLGELLHDSPIIPINKELILVHIQGILNDFFAFSPPIKIINSQFLHTLYIHLGPCQLIMEMARSSFVIFGLIFAPFFWIKKPRQYIFEIFLFLSVLIIVIFYLIILQDLSIRMLVDLWAIILLLCLQTLQNTFNNTSENIKKLCPLCFLVFVFFSIRSHADFHSNKAGHLIEGPITLPFAYDGQRCQKEEASYSVSCDDIFPKNRSLETIDMSESQSRLHQLGIYHLGPDNCQMLFYSGLTLKVDPFKNCKLQLTLNKDEFKGVCSKINIFTDGQGPYPMKLLPNPTQDDHITCQYSIPTSKQQSIIFNFSVLPIEAIGKDSIISNLPLQTRRYHFYSASVLCDPVKD